MNKDKVTCTRLQDLDFQYISRKAKELDITVSEYVRRLIKADKKKETK